MEAQLNILPREKCISLGEDVVIESEFCAAKENKEYISGKNTNTLVSISFNYYYFSTAYAFKWLCV